MEAVQAKGVLLPACRAADAAAWRGRLRDQVQIL
jgi:hypothetical protein